MPITAAITTATTATTTTGSAQAGRRRGASTGMGTGVEVGIAPYGTPLPYGDGVAPAPIAFVTDYGASDTYAAALSAAVWSVDAGNLALTGMHGVPPGDVLAGAYHVKALAAALPPGAVICAVVDPGVGTERRAIAVDLGGRRVVAPDNGLVSYLWDECPPLSRECVELPVPDAASATFHGRDVFAPAAARLAAGAQLRDLGERSHQPPQLLGEAFAAVDRDTATAVVCVVDRFGNAITTLRDADVQGRRIAAFEWDGGRSVIAARTYAEIPDGALAMLMGSAGHWEVVAREAPAADLGGPQRGDTVRVHLG